MKHILFILSIFFVSNSYSQKEYKIVTDDIANFWNAYDLLATAINRADSLSIIQSEYLDKATEEFKVFIDIRNLEAKGYVDALSKYPKFWKSVRPNTATISERKHEIREVFKKLEDELPDFEQPDICFALGYLKTGGTIADDLILIGSEIAASSDKTDKSELTPWLQTIIGNTGDIVSMIAHETVHTQQRNKKKYTLITGAMSEGIADFIPQELLGLSINKELYAYGYANESSLREQFKKDLVANESDYSQWLYNGNSSKDIPADMGYFIGHQIARAYYDSQTDKKKALKNLLNQKKYSKILEESTYLKQH